MQLPNIDNWILDSGPNVKYNVKAYRELTKAEIVQAVRIAVSGMKRKPKKNSSITITSIIGHDE